MDKETLYELRSLVATYPYFQTARLLMLQNLYLLHDSTFDEELRRAAIYLTDRTKLYELVEAKHHTLSEPEPNSSSEHRSDRTASLIDRFLNQIPSESASPSAKSGKPTVADATMDYVSYLLRSESSEIAAEQQYPEQKQSAQHSDAPSRTSQLIDGFLGQGGRITLPEITAEEEKAIVEAVKLVEDKEKEEFIQAENKAQILVKTTENDEISEDLAQKYIKQGNYLAAKDIILQLNLNNSEKSVYFADQIRFLNKLITLTGNK